MVTVEDTADVSAFANFSPPEAPKAAAPPPEAPKAEQLPKVEAPPKAAPPAAKPTPVAKVEPVAPAVAAQAVDPPASAVSATSPLAKRMVKQQLAYLEAYGTTGYKPIQTDEAA